MAEPKALRSDISLQAKQEYIWAATLRQRLPPGVYDAACKMVVRGESMRVICNFLHERHPKFSFETYRRYFSPIAKQLLVEVEIRRERDGDRRAIMEFSEEKLKQAEAALPPQPLEDPLDVAISPQHGPGTPRRIKRQVERILRELDAEQALKYAWFVAQRRVDEMMDREQRLGVNFPEGYKDVQVLINAAGKLLEFEKSMGKNLRGPTTTMENRDPLFEKIASLDAVDRNLIVEATNKFKNMVMAMSNEAAEKREGPPQEEFETPSNGDGAAT